MIRQAFQKTKFLLGLSNYFQLYCVKYACYVDNIFLYLLRTVIVFFKQVSVSDVSLQKCNFGRKQQINVCPKFGFDVRNFGQFSIKK